ncbi:hypothetical protein D3C83_40500 [compost metagenome]
MPVDVIVLELALLRNLREFRLQFLQADDVRLVAREPFAKLRLAGADAVDVPGRDFHPGSIASASNGAARRYGNTAAQRSAGNSLSRRSRKRRSGSWRARPSARW